MTVLASGVNAAEISPPHLRGLGYQQLTAANLAAAKTLPSIPAKALEALVQCAGGTVRWRVDGPDPTAAIGATMADGDAYVVRGRAAMEAFDVILASGAPELNITYMG